MTFSNAGSVLARLTQVNQTGVLANLVSNLPVAEFVCLLDFITAEFQQYLRALELINNASLESILEQVLDALTVKIGQILKAEKTTIYLVDTQKGVLWSNIRDGNSGQMVDVRAPMNVGILGHVAMTGESLNITDAYHHPLFDPEVDEHPGVKSHNLLCVPIFSSKTPTEAVAVVQLLNKTDNEVFNEEDEAQFQEFAEAIGIILESCQSFYVAARNQRGVNALLKATTSLGQSLDMETTLRSVMDLAKELMQADRSTLFLLSKDTGELWTKVAKADGRTMMEIRIPANKGIAGYVASTGQTLNIPDAYQDPRFDPSTDQRTGYKTRNILCMPVFNGAGDLIGVTQLINKHQGSFSNSDEAFLRAFNSQAGIALENAQLFGNVMVEKQYQKDILESLSNAVISTDMQGRIVTINEAALEFLGCPTDAATGKYHAQVWEQKLIGRYIWEVVPIDNLQMRLEDSLTTGARHFVPEQNLTLGLYATVTEQQLETNNQVLPPETYILAIGDRTDPDIYIPWNETPISTEGEEGRWGDGETGSREDTPPSSPVLPGRLPTNQVKKIDRTLNLTVTPLTNPEGGVRGGLVVLEDISREKRMRATMYRYMTPGVAERVMELGEDSLMVGERKEVTILFSDIRGYTTITENRSASEVVALLNGYFETMVEAVFNCEGTLDKFIGDALMAVFGAPLPLKDHAWKAVKSALDMRYRLEEFNRRSIIDNQPEIRIGIGISSGEVVSGNIGSQKRMDYTVIGDGVNLSSRLESITKEYKCDIILSEYTYNLCPDRILVRELDRVRVKGKNEAVSIYELIGDITDPIPSDVAKFLEIYAKGRAAYVARKFQRAISIFQQAKEIREDDRAVEIHIKRARNYLQFPPPDSWDGAYTMDSK
ncbi:GAF domain-containing protein [[Phormidium] sp. ETS-05]|uniref:GAF domain-containing protein n=1 Tax=[Phormidium] sp. ETS-05 TaxID=222819 RepID=UPI0018EEF5BE|nr:GAF domain-containing protein [[Phormidium] sp. ETS-05]